jgi:hypothetical protein
VHFLLRFWQKNHYDAGMSWIKASFLIFVFAMSSGYRFRCWMFCMDQTSTQHEYIEQRDRCREYAELKQDMQIRGTIKGPVTNRDRKTALVSLFNECMANNGYNITNPTPPPPMATGAQPAVAPMALAAGQANASTGNSAKAPVAVPVSAAIAGSAGAQPARPLVAERSESKSALSRSAECNFARHAAKHSSISATRAKACDLECAQRLKIAPDGPRPAACPTDRLPNPEMERGVDRGE